MSTNYFFNTTSKHNEDDNKPTLTRRRYELLTEMVWAEIEELKTKGRINESEESLAATMPPFEYRLALELAQDVVRREAERVLDFMAEEIEEAKEESASEFERALRSVGIEMLDSEGKFRGAIALLVDIRKAWQALDKGKEENSI